MITDIDLEVEFPQSMVNCLVDFFAEKLGGPEVVVVDRPLRPMDENGAIGIYAVDCTPMMESNEIGMGYSDPILNRYQFKIQNMGKGDQQTAGRRYAADAKIIRRMLASDANLPVRFQTLTETTTSTRERIQRFGFMKQRYLNNEMRGTFIYLAVTEFYIETETISF